MKVRLTPEQVDQLLPYIARVRAAANSGSPGMLVAQIRRENDESPVWAMEPCFLDHDKAAVIEHAGREISK